jgi:hypothetical protein
MPVFTPRLYGGALITALAPVATLPTTAAQFAIWNGEPQGGKTYYFTGLGFTGIASAAAVIVEQLLVHICPGNQPLIAGTAAKGPIAVDGNPVRTSNAQVLGAVTLSAVQAAAGFWHPAGPAFNSGAATATISGGGWMNVNGVYQLPPGGILSLAVLCSAAASATNLISATWSEY